MSARLLGIAPRALVAIAVALVVVLALLAPGFPVRKLALNDSGIWVTNDAEALYGRLNKAAGSLDGLLGPAGESSGATSFSLDVVQDGSAVLARDLRSGRVTAIDVATVTHRATLAGTIEPAFSLDLRGGTAAVLDPVTGRVWAVRYDTANPLIDVSRLESTEEPLAELGHPAVGAVEGQAAALSVGVDGVIHAVSTNGAAVTIRPDDDGFADAEYDQGPERSSVQIAAVGGQAAILDAQEGLLTLADGTVHDLGGDPNARLQGASAASAQVVVATSLALLGIGSDTVQLAQGNGGAPARPEIVLGCAFAAWPGTPGTVARSCDGVPASAEPTAETAALTAPVFRTNHDQIVLNDSVDGKVYSFDEQRYVENWDEAQPLESTDQGDPEQDSRTNEEEPPRAHDDAVGARPGRTTVAHVLDNDADQAGRVLAVVDVTQPDGGASASIAPDGQSILITLPQDARDTSFSYTISNGVSTDSALVDVRVRSESDNATPRLRVGADVRTFSVASSGTIEMPALGDWRDDDGDAVAIDTVDAGGEKVGATTDGWITFTAPRVSETTVLPITYTVSDGRGEAQRGTIQVKVLAEDATSGDAPTAEPDAVRGVVGSALPIRPLDNDIAGADPLNPRATLELAARVQGVDGLEIETDLTTGEILVTALEARTYFVDYTIKYGSSSLVQGTIRIDALEAGPTQPTAAPDQVTIRGRTAVMVDVLANDSDPTGALLVVQSAQAGTTTSDGSDLTVAVLQGRWVRIMPTAETLSPNPQIVRYTISNGLSDPVEGTITVTQLPAPRVDEAILHDDEAVVRAGDSVLIDALANDTSTSGSELVIDRNVEGLAAGQLRVRDPNADSDTDPGDIGRAYVVNEQIRYIAPATVSAPREITVEYQASVAGGTPQTGLVTVTVTPAPTDDAPNQAPEPQNVEARASAGQTIEIPIESWGQDPDGDTVTVLGLASAPTLGRVLSFTPNAITYQAYPSLDNGGTDTFRYLVTDAYGATESGVVRVAITPPGDVQPPVAVADVVTAAPDTEVKAFPLTNDMVDDSDGARIVPFERLGNTVPDGVALESDTGPVTARTPGEGEAALQFAYALESSGGVGPAAQITIRSQVGYRNPARLYDTVATPDGTVASAAVLERAWDPDGETDALSITRVSHPEAVVDGGVITIPLAERAQVISYEVTDATGATSAAVVFVPAAGSTRPHLRAGGLIEMDSNSTLSVALGDYVESSRGEPVRITVAESLSASPQHLTVTPASATELLLTSSGDYVGPAAITVEVTDGEPGDPEAQSALVSIPVQIGDETPVLFCPAASQDVVQGGAPVTMQVSVVCSVWTPDPAAADSLTYTAEIEGGLAHVTARGGVGTVTVEAGSNAVAGASGTLRIGVADSAAVPQEVTLRVVAAPLPTLAVTDITGVREGTSVTQQIQLGSPLRDPTPRVVSIEQIGGTPASASVDGSRFTITPAMGSSGVLSFRVVATDVSDLSRTDRQVTATLTVSVYGVPDAPSAPEATLGAGGGSVIVTFTPGADHGSPITAFEVRGGGRTVDCGRATRCIVSGLEMGAPVSFEVRARNEAGWSQWSSAGSRVTPDERPGGVSRFSAGSPSDGSLVLRWSPAANEGSALERYVISYGGRTVEVPGTATSATITGLDNNATYTFSIVAQNAAGVSQQAATTTGQASGRPTLSRLGVTTSDLGSSAQVTVAWAAADPQGPRPVTYTLTRTGGSAGSRTWTGLTGTSVGDTLAYDGAVYTYTLTATNATGGTAHTSAAVQTTFTATGSPGNWGEWSATATGKDGQVSLTYTVPASRGQASSVTLLGAGGTRTLAQGSGTTSTSFTGVTINGLTNGQSSSLQLRVCNEGGACTTSSPLSVTPYGPLGQPTLTVSTSEDTVTWQAAGNGNGRNARLQVSDGKSTPSTEGAGSLGLGPTRVTVGYGQTVTITATLSDPSGGREKRSVSRTVTTDEQPPAPEPVRSVTVWQGQRAHGKGCWYHGGGMCYYIGITTTGFGDETYTCTTSFEDDDYRHEDTFTGDVSVQTDKYAGRRGTVTVNCGGTTGSLDW